MNCRLCGADAELQNSHIIPEFIYKPLYDKKHRFMKISFNPDKKVQLPQKGLREYLLCHSCETKLSQNEKYVSEFIYGEKQCKSILRGNRIYIQGLDYKKVRLCYLSILWRMSIASSNMFKNVSLGSKHEERLRNLILNDDPGLSNQYGFWCCAPQIDGIFHSDLILPPIRSRVEGHITYWIVIGGFLYIFFVSSQSIHPDIVKYFIQDNGEWIIKKKDASKIPYIVDMLKRILRADEIRKHFAPKMRRYPKHFCLGFFI